MQDSLYFYKFEVTKVYDGDTVYGTVDIGFNTFKKIKVRLQDINSPEIRTRDKVEKAKGYAARDFLRELLETSGQVYIRTKEKGKYGRWIGELFVDECTVPVTSILVAHNHAKRRKY